MIMHFANGARPMNETKSSHKSDFAKEFTQHAKKYEKLLTLFAQKERVLDLGCGDGSFAARLSKVISVKSIHGIDRSPEAVQLALDKGVDAHLVDLDEQDIPFPDGYFDAIFAGEIIEHVFDPDRLLSEANRVLKDGGVLVITTPNLSSWFNRLFLLFGYQPLFMDVSPRHSTGHPFSFGPFGHVRLFTLRALLELLKLHGFRPTHIDGFGINTLLGYGKRWKWAAIIANTLLRSASLSSDLLVVCQKRA